jgi:hypothetical protein
LRRLLPFAFLIAACSRGASSDSAAGDEALPNVRLGMAPRDVRDRFHPGGEGSWQTSVGTGGDTILEWTPRDAADPAAAVRTARFEFHLAMLVAIRARMAAGPPAADRVTATPKTVTLRARAPEGGTNVTVLARDCPTHHDEAEGLAARAH